MSRLITLLVLNTLSMIYASGGGGDGHSSYTYNPEDSHCDGTEAHPCGPEYWHTLAGNGLCEDHHDVSRQSPIDLSGVEIDKSIGIPEFEAEHGGCESWVSGANSHAYEVNFNQAHCYNLKVVWEHTTYTFLHFHFHSPSEHTIGGAHFAAEAHMVHKSSDHKLLVIGVLLQEESSSFPLPNNTFLNHVWGGRGLEEITEEHTHNGEYINPYASFTPANMQQFFYDGSLTTPPCTEHIQWLVYHKPIIVSKDDIRIIRESTAHFHGFSSLSDAGNFNRPVQPANGREIKLSSGLAVESHSSEADDDANSPARAGLFYGAISLALILGLIILLGCIVKRFVDRDIDIKLSGLKSKDGKEAELQQQKRPQDARLSQQLDLESTAAIDRNNAV